MQGISVHILLDSGSTTSFIGEHLVAQLHQLQPEPIHCQVQVAGGGQLQSFLLVRRLQWTVDNCQFQTDFRVLSLSSFDIILGMDWLECFSPMSVDWREKWISIPYGGKSVLLQGLYAELPTQILLQISPVTAQPGQSVEQHTLPPVVQNLLDTFASLFEAPTSLPPSRAFNHSIPLIPGAQPVFIRPYRYPPALKDEIEKQVQEMLTQGLIRPSSSPFSSPVLLVKKKDGSF